MPKAKDDANRLKEIMVPLNGVPGTTLNGGGIESFCSNAMWENAYKAYTLRFDIEAQIEFCLKSGSVDPFLLSIQGVDDSHSAAGIVGFLQHPGGFRSSQVLHGNGHDH